MDIVTAPTIEAPQPTEEPREWIFSFGSGQRAYAFGERRLWSLLAVRRSYLAAAKEAGRLDLVEAQARDSARRVADEIVGLLFPDDLPAPEGIRLDGSYIAITGTYMGARDEMVRMFGPVWSMQYGSRAEAGIDEFGLTELRVLSDTFPGEPEPVEEGAGA
jgi:hypothetical protein